MSARANALANVVGRIWVAALGAVLIPVYVKYLGVESYALVGIHGTLQMIFGLLDLGLGAGLNRELARLQATEASDEEQRDLLATFDVIGAAMGFVVGGVVFLLAPVIAYRWLSAQELDRAVIVDVLRMIGVIIGLQLPIGFYHGGVNGLERQVLFNVFWIITNTVRGAGAVLVLIFVAANVRAFFAWQVVMAVMSVVLWAVLLHRLIDGDGGRGRPRRALFDRVWRYSAGWLANGIGVAVLGFIDKIVLSRVLTLKDFGYYTFASYGSQLLLNLVASVSAAFFPRFNSLIARKDYEGLTAEYRMGNQANATLLIPATLVIVFFTKELLLVWTRDAALTAATWKVVAVLAAGMAAFGLSYVSYTAALCEGMFRTTIRVTVAVVVIWVPIMVLIPRWFGVVGAAVVWALMNASRSVIVPLLHRKYLKGEGRVWALQALIAPALVVGLIGTIAKMFAPPLMHPATTLAYLTATWLVMVVAVAAVEPAMRASALSVVRRFAVKSS